MKKRVFGMILLLLAMASMLALPAYANEGESGTTAPTETPTPPMCDHEFGDWVVTGGTHTHTCTKCGQQTSIAHDFGEGTVTTEATCDTAGSVTYTCGTCGATETGTIEATGHSFGAWQKEDEKNHSRVCSVASCLKKETAAHTMNDGEVIKEAKCDTDGERVKTCTGCGYQVTEAIKASHSYGAWIDGGEDTHSRTCSSCGASEEAKHNWVATGEAVLPTCEEKGEEYYKCSDCGGEGYADLKALGHKYDNVCDTTCNTCGAERDAEHKISAVWSKNGSGHWHACSACGEKFDEEDHFPGPAATEKEPQICLVCSYVMMPIKNHTHEYESKLTSDKTGHWYACEGCEDQKNFEEHTYDDLCDPDCNVCGYTSETAHSFTDEYFCDETGHWSVCSICGEESEKQPHSVVDPVNEGEAQLCSVCAYELEPAQTHAHEAQEAWLSDSETHWHQCECGEKMDEAAHKWDEGSENEDSTVTYRCDVCQEERTEGEPKEETEFPWWILWMGISVVCLGAAIVLILILMAKNKPGKFSN